DYLDRQRGGHAGRAGKMIDPWVHLLLGDQGKQVRYQVINRHKVGNRVRVAIDANMRAGCTQARRQHAQLTNEAIEAGFAAAGSEGLTVTDDNGGTKDGQ